MKQHLKNIIKRIIFQFPGAYCLMFHHIDEGNILKKSRCVLDYKKFIEILDSGVEFAPLDLCVPFSRRSFYKCAVTFDDGLRDVYTVAYPELKKRNIPFTVFIVVNFLDTEGYLTTAELKEMAADPLVTIGAHGMTHDVLKGMDREAQKRELFDSQKNLEELLNIKVNYFAFSHGLYDDVTIDILKESAEYICAFGVQRAPLNFYTRHWIYHLPRINCENEENSFKIITRRNKRMLMVK